MDTWIIVLGLFAGLWCIGAFIGWVRRAQAFRLPPGEAATHQARSVNTRLYVSHALPGGIRPNRMNRGAAHVALSERRFRVAMWSGIVLDAAAGSGGRAACTGPRRLVIETTRLNATQPVQVRLEMVMPDAEAWASRLDAFLKLGQP